MLLYRHYRLFLLSQYAILDRIRRFILDFLAFLSTSRRLLSVFLYEKSGFSTFRTECFIQDLQPLNSTGTFRQTPVEYS